MVGIASIGDDKAKAKSSGNGNDTGYILKNDCLTLRVSKTQFGRCSEPNRKHRIRKQASRANSHPACRPITTRQSSSRCLAWPGWLSLIYSVLLVGRPRDEILSGAQSVDTVSAACGLPDRLDLKTKACCQRNIQPARIKIKNESPRRGLRDTNRGAIKYKPACLGSESSHSMTTTAGPRNGSVVAGFISRPVIVSFKIERTIGRASTGSIGSSHVSRRRADLGI